MTDYTQIMSCVDAGAIASCLNKYANETYKQFCPEKVIKCHNNYLMHKPPKELLYNIRKKKTAIPQVQKGQNEKSN